MAKFKKTLSLDEETIARLEQFAKEHHTNVSQAVTDWIWREEVKGDKKND